ncbi:hypothetical protein LTR91_000882 [Friedmanniomyces endolithicus]|uniref:Uncharacterized protein n=1 Tax=Friedmanniomyces endolithicus TaxID=329885 RepID=A0AAN6R1Y9_9PEZI|nr:hypothetical protein LTR94_009144 [Friedmanniomyces endolithicus]KAK0796961.1 hypothetical protein LTR38_008372 [Friedmanniomyces endolithicus]KAK0803200.1 hypothetical protein LTR59_004763 [Friedmanniomyces endolithicus]KAK0810758.1 hypothetical protein LTR75_005486 [Friedmanniomyces endolithicus]KAK0849642.1 hypothetical protein LTR03_005060 [Friedmanniomyces endolithicus]
MASQVLAQSSTTATPTTVSIYLPFNGDSLAASIITAAPTATVYAIGCEVQSGACAPGCSLDSSVTVTEGESTLRYTWSNGMHAAVGPTGTALIPDVTTVACSLYGGSRATSAVCTAFSAMPAAPPPPHGGVANGGPPMMSNNGSQTTTLAQSQISYIPITIGVTDTVMPSASSAAMGGSGSGSGTQTPGASGTGSAPAAATTNAGVFLGSTAPGVMAWVVAAAGAGGVVLL